MCNYCSDFLKVKNRQTDVSGTIEVCYILMKKNVCHILYFIHFDEKIGMVFFFEKVSFESFRLTEKDNSDISRQVPVNIFTGQI